MGEVAGTPAPAPADLLTPAWQMLQHSVAATALCDLDGRIVYVNPALVALWGFDRADKVLGRPAVELWADPDAASAARAVVTAEGAWQGEAAARRADGSEMRVWCSAHRVSGADGRAVGMMSSFVDRRAEFEAGARLAEQTRFVEAVIGSAGMLVTVCDGQGRFVRFNRECERVSGRSAKEVLGRTAEETLLAPRGSSARDAVGASRRGAAAVEGGTAVCRSEWVTPGGGRRLIEWRNSVLLDERAGRHVVSIGADVTAREAAQRALQASQRRLSASEAALRATLDAFPGWVACVDDELRYVFVNQQLVRLAGRSREQIIGRQVAELRGVAAADALRAINRRLLAGERVELERRYVAPDGKERRYWVQYRATEDEARSGRHLFYAFGTDLGELQRTQLRLRAIVEATHIGTWEWHAATAAFDFDEGLPMLGGYSIDAVPRDAVPWLIAKVHPDDRQARKGLFQRVLRREITAFTSEYRIFHRAGHVVWLLERGKVVSTGEAGQPLLVLGSTQDVSVLKQTEQRLRELNERLEARVAERTRELETAKDRAERASAAKSEFLSRMSHELRTPLNAILGFGQLLELAGLGSEEAQNVHEIMRAGRHLLDLINEVLDLAGVEAGRIDLALQPVALRPLFDECLALVAPLARPSGLTVASNVGHPAATVLADRGRLKQVVLNLLSNAIKYNRAGGRVDVDAVGAADGQCEIRVRDTGAGLEPAELERVFEPFERFGPGKELIEGTGIGLAVSKRLVELMGGAIGASSQPGRGSTFWLRLPLDAGAETSAAQPAGGATAAPLPAAGAADFTVVYVEDNAANLRLMQRFIEGHAGWRWVGCDDPRRAVDAVLAAAPDVVLLDLQLPHIDGHRLLQLLRQAGVRVPIVAVSANATRADIDAALAAGFDDYLTKPLELWRVLAAIAGLLTLPEPAAAALR